MKVRTKDMSQMMLNKAGDKMVSNLRRKEIRDAKRGYEVSRGRAKSANERLIEKANRVVRKAGRLRKYTPEDVEHYIAVYKDFLKDMKPMRALAEAAHFARCHRLTFRKMLRGTYFDKVKSANEKYGLTAYVSQRGRPKRGFQGPEHCREAVLDWFRLYQHKAPGITIGVIGQKFKVSYNTASQIADGSYYRSRWGEIPPESDTEVAD